MESVGLKAVDRSNEMNTEAFSGFARNKSSDGLERGVLAESWRQKSD